MGELPFSVFLFWPFAVDKWQWFLLQMASRSQRQQHGQGWIFLWIYPHDKRPLAKETRGSAEKTQVRKKSNGWEVSGNLADANSRQKMCTILPNRDQASPSLPASVNYQSIKAKWHSADKGRVLTFVLKETILVFCFREWRYFSLT